MHYASEILSKAILEKDSNIKLDLINKEIYFNKQALKINPKFTLSLTEIGKAYTYYKFIPDSAIYYLNTSLSINNNTSLAYLTLGVLYYKLHRYKMSSYFCNKALAVNQNNDDARKMVDQYKKNNINVSIYPEEEYYPVSYAPIIK
jgi:tetratricopeptide (TPR) repeat protein